MRGVRKLSGVSKSLFPEPQQKETTEEAASLYDQKVSLLCARFVWYAQNSNKTKLTTQNILIALEKEFFISGRTISDIIQSQEQHCTAIRNNPATLTNFKRQYPGFTWS